MKMSKKEIFKKAHRLTKVAMVKYGRCNYRVTFAAALRIIYAELNSELTLKGRKGTDKVWLAEITGEGGPYKLERDFVDDYTYGAFDRKWKTQTYYLETGKVYEYCDRYGRGFAAVVEGRVRSYEDYHAAFNAAH